MFVQQTQYTIEKIIHRIRAGRLALPDFQRDFVWSPTQVADLLESISREWPIGSLLLLNGPQPFAFRSIDSAPKVSNSDLDLYVLDGQQRVTSIYHAVQDVSPFVYFVDFNKISNETEEVISWERRSKFEKKYSGAVDRARAGIALVSDLWENEHFHSWLDLCPDTDRARYVSIRERRLSGLQSKVYQLLAIELEQGIELEALAKIFETLNKTGVRLNAFDLLVAKLYPSNFNLRDEWDLARASNPLISRFDPDGLEIIKLLALLVRVKEGRQASRGVRQGDVLALEPHYISRYWNEATDLYNTALGAIEQFGVTDSYLVPSWSMVLGVAACIISPRPEMVRKWWMSRLITQTFAQAANTRIVSDFEAVVRGDYGLGAMDDIDPMDVLDLAARPNGLLLRGVMALAISDGAQDPATGALLSEVKRANIAALNVDGSLGKVSQETTLWSVVFVADREVRKSSKHVQDEPAGAEALVSQGINPSTMRREWEYVQRLFQ